ncbi:hypothetical protein [Streptococcus sp. zg-JUN1979]|uniref:hypothetical protein n=1 Tax=Streptococcus sp. zg-JUN1979 TaxID=3391450 RepID=UPI0039A5F06F
MKKWKTIAITVMTTSALVTAGALTYSYLQPSHYEGDTFTTSTGASSSNTSTSTNDSSSDTNAVYTESNSTEDLNYQSLFITIGITGSTADTYNYCRGFYYIAPTQNLAQTISVVQLDDNHNVVDEVTVYGEAGETNLNNLSRNEAELNSQSVITNAEDFVTWLRQQAPDGTTTNGLQSNYNYWVKNCKYKYKQ